MEEHFPGFSRKEELEGLSSDGLVDYILEQGQKATEIENNMNLASDVLEASYGLTVEDVLLQRERDKGNGQA